jgi:hypothetical protein
LKIYGKKELEKNVELIVWGFNKDVIKPNKIGVKKEEE